jgi:stearoyl-CoA desaturase (Delta-9 desaturase)
MSMLLALGVALLVATLVTQATFFATTICLHRTVTHRSLVLHPAVAWIFRAWIWFTTGLVVREYED